jgi:restriction system protein
MSNQSKTTPKRLWVIRAGKKGDAHDLFMGQCLIVLEHQELGDLRKLQPNRSAFYKAYAAKHPDDGKVAIGGIGGKFYRFIHEIKVGESVLYACLLDKNIYHGKVTGEYFYDQESKKTFPHRRKIQWQGWFPKKSLSEFARRELGAARTLFEITKNFDEIKQALSSQNKMLKSA